MEITLDRMADAMYIKIKDGKFGRTEEIDEDTFVDLDKDGNLIGIELLSVSTRADVKDLKDLHLKLLA